MTTITTAKYAKALPEESSVGIDWSGLVALARLVRVDEASGAVTVTNGDARITLHRDGTVRIDARRIVNSADEDIVLHAARIDLN